MRGVDVAVDERVHLFPGAGRNLLFAHGSGRRRKSRVGRDQKERVACGNKEAEKLLKVWKEHPKLRLAKLAEELPQEPAHRCASAGSSCGRTRPRRLSSQRSPGTRRRKTYGQSGCGFALVKRRRDLCELEQQTGHLVHRRDAHRIRHVEVGELAQLEQHRQHLVQDVLQKNRAHLCISKTPHSPPPRGPACWDPARRRPAFCSP